MAISWTKTEVLARDYYTDLTVGDTSAIILKTFCELRVFYTVSHFSNEKRTLCRSDKRK